MGEAVDRDAYVLYELYNATPLADRWQASNGARWDLRSNALRTIGWTSADAAGLPIFAGLVRYDEVAAGHIDHALRFTVNATQKGFVLPATHFASSSTDPNRPPMGLRLRQCVRGGRHRPHPHPLTPAGSGHPLLESAPSSRHRRRRVDSVRPDRHDGGR